MGLAQISPNMLIEVKRTSCYKACCKQFTEYILLCSTDFPRLCWEGSFQIPERGSCI